MCFAKKAPHRKNLDPKYNEEDGSVNENVNDSSESIAIPVDIPEHVDNPFLDQSAIQAFVYETKDEVITVWTSEEAQFVVEFEESCPRESEVD